MICIIGTITLHVNRISQIRPLTPATAHGVDLQTQVQAWLRRARKQPDPEAWLDALHEQATTALAAGDLFVTTTAFESESSTLERRFDAALLQQVTELCLQRLEAETAAGGSDHTPAPGAVRYADFGSHPSTLG